MRRLAAVFLVFLATRTRGPGAATARADSIRCRAERRAASRAFSGLSFAKRGVFAGRAPRMTPFAASAGFGTPLPLSSDSASATTAFSWSESGGAGVAGIGSPTKSASG